jgi:hypothetical protein
MLTISALFQDDTLSPMSFAPVLNRMGRVIDSIAAFNKRFDRRNWHLAGASDRDASLYPAFDNEAPTTAALAVLKEKFRKSPDQTYVALWDGHEDTSTGVSMACHVGPTSIPRSFLVEIVDQPELQEVRSIAAIVSRIAQEFSPACIEVAPLGYSKKQVFDDKPAVGWMLYLPQVLSTRQVPEARALIAVPEKGRKQTGTIVVSVTDSAFSVDNPQHIEIANRIEIRLVDQDLLPRYMDI